MLVIDACIRVYTLFTLLFVARVMTTDNLSLIWKFWCISLFKSTVELVVKDRAIGYKNVVSQDSVCDRYNYTEMQDLLTRICGLLRQVVSLGSGLSSLDRFQCTVV